MAKITTLLIQVLPKNGNALDIQLSPNPTQLPENIRRTVPGSVSVCVMNEVNYTHPLIQAEGIVRDRWGAAVEGSSCEVWGVSAFEKKP